MAGERHYLRRLSDWTNSLVLKASIALLVVMLGLSLTAIFYLIITGRPVTWGTSLTRLLLPWIAFLSITVTMKKHEHIGITLFIRFLPSSLKKTFALINRLILGLLGVSLVWYGIGFFMSSTQMLMITDTIQLSHKWTAIVVPLTGVIITIHVLGESDLIEIDNNADQF